ncbi:MAG: hypothetical protein GY928_21005 [Colwellia sp.]|nr:hypothetical protein [Colwellia sp.]
MYYIFLFEQFKFFISTMASDSSDEQPSQALSQLSTQSDAPGVAEENLSVAFNDWLVNHDSFTFDSVSNDPDTVIRAFQQDCHRFDSQSYVMELIDLFLAMTVHLRNNPTQDDSVSDIKQ